MTSGFVIPDHFFLSLVFLTKYRWLLVTIKVLHMPVSTALLLIRWLMLQGSSHCQNFLHLIFGWTSLDFVSGCPLHSERINRISETYYQLEHIRIMTDASVLLPYCALSGLKKAVISLHVCIAYLSTLRLPNNTNVAQNRRKFLKLSWNHWSSQMLMV